MATSLTFSNAKLLSYDHTHDFFGDNLNYAAKKHLVIQGCIYNLTNGEGVAGIWEGIDGFVKDLMDYDSVTINGYTFGRGRINTITFTEGNDVRKKEYSVDLTIFAVGNLYNLIGDDFTGITLPNIHLTERFTESFDFNIAEDGTYTYRQNVDVKYIKGGTIPDPIAAAKTLASQLINSTPIYGFINSTYAGFYNASGRRTYTESYNKITNDCSFTENFLQDPEFGNYSWRYNQELNTNEDGISTLIESGHIEGLTGPDYLSSALTGLNLVLGGSLARAQILLAAYITNPNSLNTSYIVLQKKINQFTNSVDYVIQYNNDPRNHITYSWEYTQEISRSNTCFYQVKENGRVRGIGSNCTKTQQYNNALAGWYIVRAGIGTRLASYYLQVVGITNSLVYISSSERKAIHEGEISYEYTYTDDPTYSGSDPIKRTEVEIQENLPTHNIQRFAIPNVGEVAQDIGLLRQGKRGISVRLLGRRNAGLSTYIAKAKAVVGSHLPAGEDVYIDACSYSFSPTENVFDLSLEWVYIGPAGGIFV